ncbi:hypothetical protein DACRYDRAFT_115630 [Dacryopinax primogenitus]|uniref:F-box domain-containing protein n=1 Tax=Dacryopinax primogenitus (strain DJM 731) TaxID=1858805 RepID=M5G9P2_DACPD|nr:uncharacterized protein DACRYDRAFT_115630 [Dacryopinax primogenitus]EJU02587.1 hypothetical protein DACRYDRAFT_115630 [Dacryopinax primogenitus]
MRLLEASPRSEIVRYTPAIGRLPTELLQEIFLFAVDDDDKHKHTKWVVSHVCRHWRHVATHYPRLWSRMRFDPTTRLGSRRLLQAASQMAQAVDLDICMTWSATSSNWAGRREKANFIALALSRRSQWKSLVITDNEFGVESNLAVLAEGVRHAALPRLKSVQYHTTRNGGEGHRVFELVTSASNLEVLNLRNVDFMGRRVPERLRILRLDNCNLRTIDALYEMLALVPNLKVLHISIPCPTPAYTSTTTHNLFPCYSFACSPWDYGHIHTTPGLCGSWLLRTWAPSIYGPLETLVLTACPSTQLKGEQKLATRRFLKRLQPGAGKFRRSMFLNCLALHYLSCGLCNPC